MAETDNQIKSESYQFTYEIIPKNLNRKIDMSDSVTTPLTTNILVTPVSIQSHQKLSTTTPSVLKSKSYQFLTIGKSQMKNFSETLRKPHTIVKDRFFEVCRARASYLKNCFENYYNLNISTLSIK